MLSTAAKKIFARCVTGLAVALVWNRFWDDARWTVTNYACFLLGAWFLASAWFNYLKLDGVGERLMKKKDKAPVEKKQKHFQKQMIDYAEEEPDFMEPWDPKQLTFCNLISNLTAGIIFLIPAIITSL